jgi:tripartite-type tricarboxylate transporter receptor subunit TctC
MIRIGRILLGLVALAAALPVQAHAQAWPTRFVRMVVPGGSGTAADVSARIIAQALSERWAQQVVVENRPGAGGITGTVHIAQSAPDGYSLLFAQGAPLSLTPNAFKSVPYDVERDFEPVIFVTNGPLVLASSPKLPVKTVAELIELARKQPGKLTFATASSRSIPHLAAEYFLKAAGVEMVNVPYNGYPRAIQDTITGTVDVIFGGAQIIPQRENGNLRMLGVTVSKRLPDYPDIPTIAETVPGYAISGWAALLAPKGTPAPIVARINADMRQVLEAPEVTKRLHALGNYPDTTALGTPEALMRFIREDSALMARILRAANLAPQDASSR